MVVIVIVISMVMRGMAVCRVVVRARRAVPVPVVVRVAMRIAMPVAVRVAGTVTVVVPGEVRRCLIVVMVVAASTRLPVARRVAVRVLAGRRRRVANSRRLRVARIGAAGLGAAGMTVSWVVGTLRVGHDNLLYGLTEYS
ncbi:MULTISPECIES: hypothetical protein [unclassified Burkholderia]|uniref:hypothetical protein n=1 Tax=unclassified Burkholderia TaxID=2613784 RepID=UPI0021AB7728|nr:MULTISPECIES: hypothetical protein [unclassified Burkholderia]